MTTDFNPTASMKAAARADDMDLQTVDLHYLVGWLTSTAPAALEDALDAVEARRRALLRPRATR